MMICCQGIAECIELPIKCYEKSRRLIHGESTIYHQFGAGNKPGSIGGKELDCGGYVGRFANMAKWRFGFDVACRLFGIAFKTQISYRLYRSLCHLCLNEAGMEGVDPDFHRPVFNRSAFAEESDCAFGCAIRGETCGANQAGNR